MDLNNLSSNWKQLQAKLKASNSNQPTAIGKKITATQPLQPSSSSKRKRSELHHRPQAQAAPRKKQRRDDAGTHSSYKTQQERQQQRQQQRRGKMSNGTVSTAGTNSLPNGDAAEKDGASGEIAAASAVPTTLVNAGLSRELVSPPHSFPHVSPIVPSNNLTNIPFPPSSVEAGKFIALDCEMVGIGPQPGPGSALARVSLVNFHGTQLYDSYVIPRERVSDWRTHVSGIKPSHMVTAREFAIVQAEVAALLKGRVLVGHSVRNDLEVLELDHPRRDVRDTARYPPYRAMAGGVSPRLKVLVSELLGLEIQGGEHSSVEDARATMMLFRRDKAGFERENAKRWGVDRREVEVVAVKEVVGSGVGDVDEDADGGATTKKKKNTTKKSKKKKKKR